jgi:cation:H+ antiporter
VTFLVLQLLAMLLVILAAAELFTNALEHLGDRLGISEGVTGSLFAAVGTALPETAVPLLAVFGASPAGQASIDTNLAIGTGAILGAPLMLSTLSTFLMACSVLRQRGWTGRVQAERSGLLRDLHFFLGAFALAAIAMFVPPEARFPRAAIAAALVALYFCYVLLTLRASRALVEAGHGTQAGHALMVTRIGIPDGLPALLVQLAGALALLVFGAKGFIAGVDGVSRAIGISALLLSLLVVPIATELPEKANSILWIRRGKDTLALGNITGAMVFQGTLLPAIGVALTPWEPRPEVLAGVGLTILAAIWLRILACGQGLPLWALMGNGALYGAFLVLTIAH